MHPLARTARLTGTAYLGLAVTGMLGFLLIRPQVFVAGDGALDALAADLPLARIGLLLELAIVVAQVFTAIGFFALFRSVNVITAATLSTLGLMNAVAILGSAASLATAIQITDSAAAEGVGQVALLVSLSEGFWAAGVIFFGAWLIPMGMLVLQSGYAWRWIGWALIIGGIGYMASIVLGTLAPDAGAIVDLLTIPATIGEFSILLSLLIRGVPSRAAAPTRETVAASS